MNLLREAAQQALEALQWHYRQGHSNTLGGFRLKIDEKALRELRAALAQQAEPDHETRAELAEQQVVQLAEERDHYRNLWQKAQQDEPVEPVAWKQGSLVTFNEDPYPALGGLFVQFWDGEEVAARVYANDLETIRQRCAKINAAPPQRTMVPLTEDEIYYATGHCGVSRYTAIKIARVVEEASWEKNHGQA